MEKAKAKAKAKEFGRTLLMRATRGSDSSEEEQELRDSRRPKASNCNVAARSPGRQNEFLKPSLKTKVSNDEQEDNVLGLRLGRTKSPQKLFTAEDVAKLVELARQQMRRESGKVSGWQEVESKEYKRKEKTYIKELVEDFQRSPEEVRCWQCDKTGHVSSECPRGERCFRCNNTGHMRADCPMKRRSTREEKGKAVALKEMNISIGP